MNLNMDPYMLLSIINMKLRDFYSDLENLCEDMDLEMIQLEDRLKQINYVYSSDVNQFINQ